VLKEKVVVLEFKINKLGLFHHLHILPRIIKLTNLSSNKERKN
jgi:hypothetical protein